MTDAAGRCRDEAFMRLALEEAEAAARLGEVPVGAVAVVRGAVIGRGANAPIRTNDPTAHAEICALRDAAASVGNYRLSGTTLYCSVEPCLMCLGAAIHARIERLVYGAPDPKVGATADLERVWAAGNGINHRFAITGGVLAGEAAQLIRRFFEERRQFPADERKPCNEVGEVPKWP